MTAPNQTNFSVMLAEFMKQHGLSARSIANAFTCSEATLNRVLNGSTLATEEMLRQGKLLIDLGFIRYSKLTTAERENLLAKVGVVGGGGVAGVCAVSSAVAGASGAGMASGLAAAGSVVGGGMAAGIVVAAAIPLACAGIGYAIFRAANYVVSERQLNADAHDSKWEMSHKQPRMQQTIAIEKAAQWETPRKHEDDDDYDDDEHS